MGFSLLRLNPGSGFLRFPLFPPGRSLPFTYPQTTAWAAPSQRKAFNASSLPTRCSPNPLALRPPSLASAVSISSHPRHSHGLFSHRDYTRELSPLHTFLCSPTVRNVLLPLPQRPHLQGPGKVSPPSSLRSP